MLLRYGPLTTATVTLDVYVPAYALPGMATLIVGVMSTLPRPVFVAALKNLVAVPLSVSGYVTLEVGDLLFEAFNAFVQRKGPADAARRS